MQCPVYRLHVMTVHHNGVEPKGVEPLPVHLHLVLERRGLALSESVHVHDGDQVVQLVVAGEGGGLPHAPLGALPVPHEAVDPVAGLVHVLAAVGHAGGDAQTLTQGTRGNVYVVLALEVRREGERREREEERREWEEGVEGRK